MFTAYIPVQLDGHLYPSSYQREGLVTPATQHDVKPNLKAFPMLIIGQSVLPADSSTHLFHA